MAEPIRAVDGTVWLGEHGRIRMLDGIPVVEAHDFASFAHEIAIALLAEREACAKRARKAVEVYGDDPAAVSVVVGQGIDISPNPKCIRGYAIETDANLCECNVCKAIRAHGEL